MQPDSEEVNRISGRLLSTLLVDRGSLFSVYFKITTISNSRQAITQILMIVTASFEVFEASGYYLLAYKHGSLF